MKSYRAFKGHIIDTPDRDTFRLHESSYIVVDDASVVEIYAKLPEKFRDLPVTDYGHALIIPSFIDLHVHAPQFMQRGIGLDLELIDWLNTYTFKIEKDFKDTDYAREVYPHFVKTLYDLGTLRSCIFGTIHNKSNEVLIQSLIDTGLIAYVGKVNMDRNSPVELTEKSCDSIQETEELIVKYRNNHFVKPIITPRFAPSCTEELLSKLGHLAKKYNVPVQSHIAENKNEVLWVKELFPDSTSYADVYKRFGLLGQTKTLMAHGIYLDEEELKLVKDPNVFLVHCPDANLNLTSGIMPVTTCLDAGIQVGLGSDVGAGHSIAMNQVIVHAVQSSKMRYRVFKDNRILKHSEAFYMATRGNGIFFGNTGSFEPGHSFDALVIRDTLPLAEKLNPLELLYRFLYCGDDRSIETRFLEGKEI